jgi:hypothetical protein
MARETPSCGLTRVDSGELYSICVYLRLCIARCVEPLAGVIFIAGPCLCKPANPATTTSLGGVGDQCWRVRLLEVGHQTSRARLPGRTRVAHGAKEVSRRQIFHAQYCDFLDVDLTSSEAIDLLREALRITLSWSDQSPNRP